MYGRGRGLAEEAAHELELVHRNDPEFGNASAQGGLIYLLLVFALGWILRPIRELWAVFAAGASRGAVSSGTA